MTEPLPVDTAGDEAMLAADLQRLREFLDDGHIEAARRFVKELEPRWPDSERVRRACRRRMLASSLWMRESMRAPLREAIRRQGIVRCVLQCVLELLANRLTRDHTSRPAQARTQPCTAAKPF